MKKVKVVKKVIKKAKTKKIVKKTKKFFAVRGKISKPKPKPKPEFQAQDLFRARIKVVGVGGGGGSIVSEIGKTLKKATFVVADTDARSIKKKSGIRYLLFGQEVTHGLGTGADPEIARQAAISDQEKIENIFKDQDIVIIIASLGGGVGSGATEIFAKMASSCGAISMGIFTLPFKFEGKTKSKIALKSLKELRDMLNVSITIPNEKIFKIIGQSTPITQAFSMVNKNMISSLESLIDLIYNPGTINIDFADLRSILRGKGSVAFLNTIEESGKDRAEQISEKILINPLYNSNNFTADKILFNISGSGNMSMFEVEKISSKISSVNPKAKIIFGISKNSSASKSASKLKTTLLMTGRAFEREKDEKEEKIIDKIELEAKDVKENKKEIVVKKDKKSKERKIEIAPGLALPVMPSAIIDKKLSIVQVPDKPAKKAIRRSALDVKKAQEQEEEKRLAQEQEWEIPAFLRRVKFKN